LSGSTATLTTSTLALGTHHISATYGGNADNAASSPSAPITVIVHTSTTVSSSADPSTYGNGVTFSAHITPSTAAGSVQFAVDGVNLGTSVTVSDGSATSSSLSTMAAGHHAVTATFTSNANFIGSSAVLSPDQTVDPATLTVTPDKQSVTYGDSDPSYTFSITGYRNGDTASVVTSQPSCGVAGSHGVVGSYTIGCSGGAAGSNYSFDDTATATLTVGRATLTVTPDNQSKVYGAPDPALSFSVTGYRNGDTPSVVTAEPSCSVSAPHTSVGSD